MLGLSPIAYAREAIGLGLGAEKYGAKLFADSAIPSGVLTSDQRIGQPEADNLKARWKQAHQGRREIAVLGGGAKFQPVTIAPDEAQFIQTQKFSVATICRRVTRPSRRAVSRVRGRSRISAHAGTRAYGHQCPGPSTYHGRKMTAARPASRISRSPSIRTAMYSFITGAG